MYICTIKASANHQKKKKKKSVVSLIAHHDHNCAFRAFKNNVHLRSTSKLVVYFSITIDRVHNLRVILAQGPCILPVFGPLKRHFWAIYFFYVDEMVKKW